MGMGQNKYSVAQRLNWLEANVTELLKHQAETTGPAGRDGRDGAQGERGPAGAVLSLDPSELQATVDALRKELLQQRAKFLAAIYQSLADSENIQGAHRQIFRHRLEQLKREAGLGA